MPILKDSVRSPDKGSPLLLVDTIKPIWIYYNCKQMHSNSFQYKVYNSILWTEVYLGGSVTGRCVTSTPFPLVSYLVVKE